MTNKVADGMVIVDIWGGSSSTVHIARYVVAIDEAWSLARHELSKGLLINLRLEPGWRGYEPFDLRLAHPEGGKIHGKN